MDYIKNAAYGSSLLTPLSNIKHYSNTVIRWFEGNDTNWNELNEVRAIENRMVYNKFHRTCEISNYFLLFRKKTQGDLEKKYRRDRPGKVTEETDRKKQVRKRQTVEKGTQVVDLGKPVRRRQVRRRHRGNRHEGDRHRGNRPGKQVRRQIGGNGHGGDRLGKSSTEGTDRGKQVQSRLTRI